MKKRVVVVLRIKKEGPETATCNFAVENKADGMDHLVFNNEHSFAFDTVLGQNSTQEQAYEAVVGNGIQHCLDGYHFAVLAYGQTCSGKTYSISGNKREPGIFPRFASKLFKHIAQENLDENIYVSFSFYEIYQEKVYDLLSNVRKPLRVRGVDESTFVEDLVEIGVKNADELEEWRQTGLSRRATAATLVNELSSRSHAIVCIKLRREYEEHTVVSMCYFVDLAGSERANSTDDLYTESISINKSLFALQRVVEARTSKANYVNYRDSVLTRLLRNCFAGNSMTTLLATVSPKKNYYGETLNTLRFASQAAEITLSPTINEYSGAETNEDLRKKNQYFIKKIKEMEEQIEVMKQQALVNVKIRAPAAVNLLQDESLCNWVPLEDGATFYYLKDQDLAKYVLKDGRWYLKSLNEHVFLNGIALSVDSVKEIKHGDIISFFDRKFCAVYLDESCNPSKFVTYDRAMLQYVQTVYTIQQKEMIDQMKAEAKQNETELRATLEVELKSLRTELDQYKQQYKTATGDGKQKLKKECEMLQTQISDTEDLTKNLSEAVSKELEAMKTKQGKENQSEKVQLRSKIDLLNGLLNQTGKGKVFEFLFHDLNSVKVYNKKNKLFAEMPNKKFLEMFDHFAECYQSDTSRDAIEQEFNDFLYSGRLYWKMVRPGVSSSLVQTALVNAMNDTANKRRSTFAEVSHGFISRRSVVADIISRPSERPAAKRVDQLVQHLSFFAMSIDQVDASVETLNRQTEVDIMLQVCRTARSHFSAFVAPDNFMTASSAQKKATSIAGMYRSIGSIDTISTAASMCYISTPINQIGLEYIPKEIVERSNILRKLVESWIINVREETITKEHGQLIFVEIDRLIQSIGFLAYYLDRRPEINDAETREIFQKGIMGAVKELTEDIPKILEWCTGEKIRDKMKRVAASFVMELLPYAQRPFKEEIAYDLLRPAILLKEDVLTLTEDRASKLTGRIKALVETAERLQENLKPETVMALKEGLSSWKHMSKISAKPPIRRPTEV